MQRTIRVNVTTSKTNHTHCAQSTIITVYFPAKSRPQNSNFWIIHDVAWGFRSQWPLGLRRGPAAACMLVLRVRIPPGHGCLSLLSVVYCQVEVSASVWSLFQRSPTECGVSECNHESSVMRRSWPTGGCYRLSQLCWRGFHYCGIWVRGNG